MIDGITAVQDFLICDKKFCLEKDFKFFYHSLNSTLPTGRQAPNPLLFVTCLPAKAGRRGN